MGSQRLGVPAHVQAVRTRPLGGEGAKGDPEGGGGHLGCYRNNKTSTSPSGITLVLAQSLAYLSTHVHGTWDSSARVEVRVYSTPPRARHRRANQLPSHIHDRVSHGKERLST